MLEQFEKLMEYCSACPRLCQSACPVAMTDGNEAHSPWGLMQTLNLLRKGEIPLSPEVAALSYQCTECRACTSQCEHGNVIPPVLHEVRKEAVRREMAPPGMAGFLAKFHRYNNPFAKDLLQKLRSLIDGKYFEKENSVVYFPGCTAVAKTPEMVVDTFSLFEKLKINFVSVYPESIQCCGYPLFVAGMEDDFVDLAEINYHALKKYKTVIVGSPTCTHTLQETYRKYSLNLRGKIMTVGRFLEPYLHNINYRIKKGIKTKLMVHDPSHLARYLDEGELARELISHVSGYQPIEFFKNGKDTGCSGHGGVYSVTNKEASDRIAARRLEEVYEKGVNLLLTQCPSCVHKFRKNSTRITVKDLVSYLNDCIEGTKE